MTLEEWRQQIAVRRICYFTELERSKINNHKGLLAFEKKEKSLLSTATSLKSGVIIDKQLAYNNATGIRHDAKLEGYSFSTGSVDSLTSYDLIRMAKNDSLNIVWNACEAALKFFYGLDISANPVKLGGGPIPEYIKIAGNPHDFNIHLHSNSNNGECKSHVVINLLASDDQIKKDFNRWLTNYRAELSIFTQNESSNISNKEKFFTKSYIDQLIKYNVIPYIDLMLIAKIERKSMPSFPKIGYMFYPLEYDIDCGGRIRQVTQEAAKLLLNNGKIYQSLLTQLMSEKKAG